MHRLGLVVLLLASQVADCSSEQRTPFSRNNGSTFRPQSMLQNNVNVKVEKYRYEPQLIDADDSGKETEASAMSDLHRSDQVLKRSPTSKFQSRIPTFDDIDKHIFFTTLPLALVFAIGPLTSSWDLFWVNRLKDTLALAGQSAANQVYSSVFWLFAFLPSVTATLVSKHHANGDIGKTQDAVCQALLLAAGIALTGTLLIFLNPTKVISSILKGDSPALSVAIPYLKLRAFSFLPMMVAFVGFSAFRGVMDVKTSVKITFLTSTVVAALSPFFIHVLGVGVRGSAMATLIGEVTAALIYLNLLSRKKLITREKLGRLPEWSSVAPLLRGGLALQVRSFAFNLTTLLVARVIQSLDNTGVAPAAHALALQSFSVGAIGLQALGMATQTMVPNAITHGVERHNGVPYAEALIHRLFRWGLSIGVTVGLAQLVLLPTILKSSPLQEVREAARWPVLIAIAFQGVNGIVNVGEGVMMGRGQFGLLSLNVVVAALAYMAALQIFPARFGLTGVWIGIGVFSFVRLIGVICTMLLKAPSNKRVVESN